MFFFRPLRWLRRLVTFIVVAILGALGYLAAMNYMSARVHDTAGSDAIVVLGAAQFNGKPSELFANRLDHARSLYKQGIAPRIVTVGGKLPGDNFTEAQAGRDYLRAAGVPSKALVVVPSGDNSWNSLQAVASKLAPASEVSITLVTDPAHMARVYDMARALGFKEIRRNSTVDGAGTKYAAGRVLHECIGAAWFSVGQRWLG
ncbi:MAG: hypothetical protein RL745_368 [Actinomycetota bacterium]